MRKPNLQCANAHLTRDKEWLEARYFMDNLSIAKIAKLIPCDYGTIRKALIRLEIPLKPKYITYGDIKYPPRSGQNSPTWKGGKHKCANCGIEVGYKYPKNNDKTICKKCSGISRRKPKQEHPDDFIRHSADYRDWRNMVFIRDGYKCQLCGKNSNDLKAHHLDGFSVAQDKRFDVSNGVTLCNTHHLEFHKQYGFGGNTKEQFDEFLSTTEMTY